MHRTSTTTPILNGETPIELTYVVASSTNRLYTTTTASPAITTGLRRTTTAALYGETPIRLYMTSPTPTGEVPLYTTTTASPAITTGLRRTTTAALYGETPIRLDMTTPTPTGEVPISVTEDITVPTSMMPSATGEPSILLSALPS